MLPPGISVSETSRQLARIRATLRTVPGSRVGDLEGRPSRGRHRSQDDQHGGVPGRREAAGRSGGRTCRRTQLIDQMNERAADDSRHRAQLLAADPRQRSREHLADRRPDRDQGLRRRHRRRCGASPTTCCGRSPPCRGVARAFVDRAGQVPQLQIEIDRARAARYGLNVADVEDVIETALGGKTATELWEGERQFRVVVRLGEEERRDRGGDPATSWSTRRAACGSRCRTSPRSSVGSGSMNIAQRIGHARGGHRRVHPGPRHGQRRQRDAAARQGATCTLPAGYFTALGRRVREPAARDGAAQPDRADQRAADLRAAVQRLRLGQARAR